MGSYLYANILLIMQDFELGINYLQNKKCKIEALHLAICLNYYGLLHISKEYDSYVKLDNLLLSFVNYLEKFKVDFKLAFYYIYVLYETSKRNKQFEKIIIEKISNPFIDTDMIGKITEKEININGELTNYIKSSKMFNIILHAGEKSELEGNFNHSLTLYTFIGAFNNIAKM